MTEAEATLALSTAINEVTAVRWFSGSGNDAEAIGWMERHLRDLIRRGVLPEPVPRIRICLGPVTQMISGEGGQWVPDDPKDPWRAALKQIRETLLTEVRAGPIQSLIRPPTWPVPRNPMIVNAQITDQMDPLWFEKHPPGPDGQKAAANIVFGTQGIVGDAYLWAIIRGWDDQPYSSLFRVYNEGVIPMGIRGSEFLLGRPRKAASS